MMENGLHLVQLLDVETGQGNPFPTYMYGVLVAEVEVDMNTGKAHVDKLTCISDVGVIVNKLVVDGQILGGLVQGIGLALTEDFEDLKKHTTYDWMWNTTNKRCY